MPDSGPVNALRARLAGTLTIGRAQRDPGWGDPKAMKAALKGVRQVFGAGSGMECPSREEMATAVRTFFRERSAATFTQLKYVCYGISLPLDCDGQRLIDRAPLFLHLLELVEGRKAEAKQFRRCYQGLVAGYFGFVRNAETPGAGDDNWLSLREWLKEKLPSVFDAARSRGQEPEWLSALIEHHNLLSDQPCQRYTESLRKGDRSELEAVCSGLGVDPSSWVWHDAVMVYIQAVVRADDTSYQAELRRALPIVDTESKNSKLPALLARDAAALLISRYERCRRKPEHPELLDICIRRIGNPWISPEKWNDAVKSEPARQMVEGWLKRRLIKDFFELLAHDGATDLRRLNYWLKWEPQISDMWFGLGGDAQNNRVPAYLKLRERMTGRERMLTGQTDHGNNAFIMRIGQLLVIEFGKIGHACFAFQATDFKASLDSPSFGLPTLKQRAGATRMLHIGPWEQKFDDCLEDLLGGAKAGLPHEMPANSMQSAVQKKGAALPQSLGSIMLDSKIAPKYAANPQPLGPAFTEKIRFRSKRYGVEFDDRRPAGGRLWIYLPDPASAPELAQMVADYGFAHISGVGFYIDPENELVPPLAVPLSPVPAGSQRLRNSDLGSLKDTCLSHGIPFRDLYKTRKGIWVELLDERRLPGLAARLRGHGFSFHEGQGFHHVDDFTRPELMGSKLLAAPKRQLLIGDFEILKKTCVAHNIPLIDLRNEGGALWVKLLSDRSHPGLIAYLKNFGFVFQVGKGFYLDPGN